MNSCSRYLQRIDVWGVLAILVPFAVYLATLAPSVTFFDSGEFITAIYSLGSAHSPGYPTFINYAKPFTYLPFGSIAFRVNIATAFSSALACYAVYLLVLQFLRDEVLIEYPPFLDLFKKVSALSAAVAFAFTARLWLQSNHDKPYPLVSFLVAVTFYLLLLWRGSYRKGDERPAYIYLGSFLCGVAFGAHQTVVLLLPVFGYMILSMDWRLISRIKDLFLAVAFAILGFSVHLHLVIRATRSPLLNWGDPQNLTQFLWHLLRKGYPVDKPQRDFDLLWAQVNAFNVPHEFTYAGFLLLALGMIVSLKKRRDEVIAYFIALFSFLAVIVGVFNTPLELIFLTEEFFTPLYLLSAVFIGVGLFYLLHKFQVICGARLIQSLPAQAFAVLLVVALPVTVGALHYLENDQHENYVAYDYASDTLRSLPQGAVLYTWGDSGAFPLWYLQGVERMRPDADLLHTPHLVFQWYLDAFPALFKNSKLRDAAYQMLPPDTMLQLSISEMILHRPVFIDFSTRYSVQLDSYALIKRGITYKLGNVSEFSASDSNVWALYSNRGLSGDMFFRDLDTGKAILIYANSHMESGENLLRANRVAAALAEMQIAESLSPELRSQIAAILHNYGIR